MTNPGYAADCSEHHCDHRSDSNLSDAGRQYTYAI